MRWRDFRGEKAWMGAEALINLRICSRFGGEKMAGSLRLVMRRVFEGGEGVIRGGRVEKSR